MEPQSPRAGQIGGIGEMSTPELLAKREQRRRMEAQAAALSRPSLSRRLLQPVQQQQQHTSSLQALQPQQSNSVAGLAAQQCGRSMFSRAGLKRSAPAAKAPAAPPAAAEAGISAEQLAKLMEDDEPAAAEEQQQQRGGSCAKRPKLADFLMPQLQQQQLGNCQGPAMRPALLTAQQQDKQASVSTAFGRVAAQRVQQQQVEAPQQQQQQQQQQQDDAIGQQTASAARQEQQQQQDGPAGSHVVPAQPEPRHGAAAHQQAQAGGSAPAAAPAPAAAAAVTAAAAPAAAAAVTAAAAPAAAAAAAAAGGQPSSEAAGGVPRWLYVKPGATSTPGTGQEQQVPAVGSKPKVGKGAVKRGSKAGSSGSKQRKRETQRQPPTERAACAATAAEVEAGGVGGSAAAAAAAAAEPDGQPAHKRPRRAAGSTARADTPAADPSSEEEAAKQPAVAAVAAARPRRQAAAAAERALAGRRAARGTAAAADSDGSELEISSSSSDSGSGSSDEASSSEDEQAPSPVQQQQQQRKARQRRGKPAAAVAAGGAGAKSGGTRAARQAQSRRKGQAAAAAAAAGAAAGAAKCEGASKPTQRQRGAAAAGSAKLNRHLQQLQDAVSNSRRAQQLSAALEEQEQAGAQQQQQQRSGAVAGKVPILAASYAKQPQQPQRQQQQQQPTQQVGPGVRAQSTAAAASSQQQQRASQLQLPDDLAKVQAALAAAAAAGDSAVAEPAAAGPLQQEPAGTSTAAAAGGDCDLLLLDEGDDLEIVDAPAAATATQQQQQQQQAQPRRAPPRRQQQAVEACRDADVHDDGGIDLGAGHEEEEDSEGLLSDELASDGEPGSSGSGSSGSGSSSGWEGSEEGGAGSDSEAGGWEEGDDEPESGDSEGADDGTAAAAAAAAADGSSSEEDWGTDDVAPLSTRAAGRRKAKASTSSRAQRTRRSAAAAAAAAEEGGDGAAAAAPPKKRRGKAAAAAAGGGVRKRTSSKAAKPAAAAGGAKPSKPRSRKPAQRSNFRRHRTSANGYGSKFLSKAAVKNGNKKWAYSFVTKSGQLRRGRRRAPHMAGQGAEFMDGFGGSGVGGGKGRCFRCGQAGHWEDDCPLLAARIAEEEAERIAWIRDNPDAEEAQKVAGGDGSGYRTTAAASGAPAAPPAAAAGAPAPTGAAAGAAGVNGTQAPAAAAAAATAAAAGGRLQPQQQARAKPARPPPLTQAQLCEMAGLAPDAAWAPEQLTAAQLASVLKAVWGHEGFRGQQLPLIRGALRGTSMLGVLPTGLGKSMTYQLPALLLQRLVVVVSPLLSLMHDQVSRLPASLPGAMLQGNMSKDEVMQVLSDAEDGRLRLLYLAPEKLSAFPVMSCLRRLDLPLVVVDEAHCMAEWGEGFRPSYFRLGHLLTNVLQPRAVLALTATAPTATRASILQLLNIPPEQQVVESPLRSNLRLRVMHVAAGATKAGHVATHVVQLLKSGELSGVGSAVVYVGFRAAADAMAAQLKRAGIPAAAYHAGLQYNQREFVQNAFLRGHVRVMVATIAFGMGLDKPDLEAVLHTNMPKSLEEYVQQVGRAGRDGRTATCVAFLDDADYLRMRALAHQRTVKRASVERFLRCIFGRDEEQGEQDAAAATATAAAAAAAGGKPAKRRKAQQAHRQSQHKVLPITTFCTQEDVDKEVLDSCLSFLQADPTEPYVAVLSNVAATLDVRFHSSAPEMLAKSHPVISSILEAKTRKYAGTYKVHMSALVPVADRPPGDLLSELSNLARDRELSLDQGSEQALAWRLIRQPDDWEALVDAVYQRLDKVVSSAVGRLDSTFEALAGAAIYGSAAAQEQHLRCMIEDYFVQDAAAEQQQGQQQQEAGRSDAGAAAVDEREGGNMLPWGAPHPVLRVSRDSLLRQLRAAVHSAGPRARDLGPGRFDGLVLARMVAGLGSPAAPPSFWKGCNEWGRMAAHDFRRLVDAAERVVQEFWQAEGDRGGGGGLRTMRG